MLSTVVTTWLGAVFQQSRRSTAPFCYLPAAVHWPGCCCSVISKRLAGQQKPVVNEAASSLLRYLPFFLSLQRMPPAAVRGDGPASQGDATDRPSSGTG